MGGAEIGIAEQPRHLPREHGGDGDQDLHRSHHAFQPLAAEEAQAQFVAEDDKPGAEESLQHGGNGVHEREKRTGIGRHKPGEGADEIEGAGEPERNLQEDDDLRAQQGLRRDGAVQQDVGFLLVEKDLARGGGDEHAAQHHRGAVQIDRQPEDRRGEEGQRHASHGDVEQQSPREFQGDGLRDVLPAQPAGAATPQK